jgi:nicotinamide-nucleotide adenylyltransferase
MVTMSRSAAPFALERARAVAAAVADLQPAAPPRARLLHPPPAGLGARVGILPGSFDPLTTAHVALAAAALRRGPLDSLCYLLSVHTVDKVDRDHAALADRALVLLRHVARRPRQGVAVANRGLYVEEAEALLPLLPPGAALWFVVGFDKIVQVLDRRYYAEPDTALARLFALAGFLVAPRAGASAADLRALLARPENRAYAERVRHLPLPPAYRRDSATEARALLAAGRDPGRLLPPAAHEFVAATGCYAAPPVGAAATASPGYSVRRLILAAGG